MRNKRSGGIYGFDKLAAISFGDNNLLAPTSWILFALRRSLSLRLMAASMLKRLLPIQSGRIGWLRMDSELFASGTTRC